MATVEGGAAGVSHDRNHPTVLGLRKEDEEAASVSQNRHEDPPKPDIFLLNKMTLVPPNSLPTNVLCDSNAGAMVYSKATENKDASELLE
jgi:hypothetical protein